MNDIITIDLYGEAEALAMAKLVDARMETLASMRTQEAYDEFLTLQRVSIPLMRYMLMAEEMKQNA